MNYTGLGRFNRYKTDRPLMDQEREDRLYRGKRSGFEPQDALTTIRVNSTYLEMVDRWYAQKGIAVWLGLLGVIPIAIWIMAMVAGIYRRGEIGGWIFMACGDGLQMGVHAPLHGRAGLCGSRARTCRVGKPCP